MPAAALFELSPDSSSPPAPPFISPLRPRQHATTPPTACLPRQRLVPSAGECIKAPPNWALPCHAVDGFHRLCGSLDGIQAAGRLVLNFVRLLHRRSLHRRWHGADPAGQAGHLLLRRWRGGGLGLQAAAALPKPLFQPTPRTPPSHPSIPTTSISASHPSYRLRAIV